MRDTKVLQLCETAIFVALIFVATFLLKFPTPIGYSHLGDCLIFVSVLMLGWKRGACAGALGAAMADLVGGFAVWILPTLIAKSLMAAIMGLVLERMIRHGRGRTGWILGAVLGGGSCPPSLRFRSDADRHRSGFRPDGSASKNVAAQPVCLHHGFTGEVSQNNGGANPQHGLQS